MSAAVSQTFPLPPSSNTGAEITSPRPLENRVLIDWFAFTSFSLDLEGVLDALGIPSGLFISLDIGGMGYKSSIAFGGIHPWPILFRYLCVNGLCDDPQRYKITRVDLAIDNIDGSLSMDRVKKGIENGQTRSRFKKGRRIEGFLLGSSENAYRTDGESIYFGSPASRLQFRIYDKAAEQECEGHWVRFELQLRDDRAFTAVVMMDEGRTVGNVATGVINQYIAFINHDDSNVSRCSLQQWWSEWLSNAEKLKLTVSKAVRTVVDTLTHIKKQYAPSLAMIWDYFGPKRAQQILEDMIVDGLDRFGKKHELILSVTRAISPYPI